MSAAPVTPDDDTQRSTTERSVRSQGESEDKAQNAKQDCPKDSDATGPQEASKDNKDNGAEAKEQPSEASGEATDPVKVKRRRGRPRKSESSSSGATATPGKPGVELRNGKRSAVAATTDNGGGSTGTPASASKRSKTSVKQRKSDVQADPCILHKDKRDLGKLVAKKFEGYGVYTGEVTQISIGARPLWRIRYEDGDGEDLTEEEMHASMNLYQVLMEKAGNATGCRVEETPVDANNTVTPAAAAPPTPATAPTTRSSEEQKTPQSSGVKSAKANGTSNGGSGSGSSGRGKGKGKGKGKASPAKPKHDEEQEEANRKLVGGGVRKVFEGHGEFDGKVTKYLSATAEDEEDLWLVKYTDGDSEHMNRKELEEGRKKHGDYYALVKKTVHMAAADFPVKNKEAGDSSCTEPKAADQKVTDQKASEQKSADQKGSEQKGPEDRGSEHKDSEQKADDQKTNDQKGIDKPPTDLQVTIYAENPAGSRIFTTLSGYRLSKSEEK